MTQIEINREQDWLNDPVVAEMEKAGYELSDPWITNLTPVERESGRALLGKCTQNGMDDGSLREIVKAEYLLFASFDNLKRRSGDPVSTHSLAVAHLLADYKMDKDTIVAGLLHDVPEDTLEAGTLDPTRANRIVFMGEIRENFGSSVGKMVELLANVKGRADQDLNDQVHLQIFDSLLTEPRTIFVKLADRLHNLSTIRPLDRWKQVQKAKETLKVYIPLAYHLGLNKMADDLTRLSLETIFKSGKFENEPVKWHDRERRYRAFMEKYNSKFTPEFVQKTAYNVINVLDGVTEVTDIRVDAPRLYDLYKEEGDGFIDSDVNNLKPGIVLTVSDNGQMGKKNGVGVANCSKVYMLLNERLFHFDPEETADFMANLADHKYVPVDAHLNQQDFDLSIISEGESDRREASLTDLYIIGNINRFELAKDKIARLVQNLRRVKSHSNVRSLVHEFIGDLGMDFIQVTAPKIGSMPETDYVFPVGGGTLLDAAIAFRTDVGFKAVAAEVINHQQDKRVTSDLTELVHDGETIRILTDDQGEDTVEPIWLDKVKTLYAKSQIQEYLIRAIRSEQNGRMKDATGLTAKAIDRGVKIIENDFKKKTGVYLSSQLTHASVPMEQYDSGIANVRRKKLVEDPYSNFLVNVGIGLINHTGIGSEKYWDVISLMEARQRNMKRVVIVARDQKRLLSAVSGIFGYQGINLDQGSFYPYQRVKDYSVITFLVPADLFEQKREAIIAGLKAIKIGKGRKPIVDIQIN